MTDDYLRLSANHQKTILFLVIAFLITKQQKSIEVIISKTEASASAIIFNSVSHLRLISHAEINLYVFNSIMLES